EHVGLRIPHIALRAEECLGTLPERKRRPPFDELVERAHRKRNAHAEERDHAPSRDVAAAQQGLARQERRRYALHQVADAVERVDAPYDERCEHHQAERRGELHQPATRYAMAPTISSAPAPERTVSRSSCSSAAPSSTVTSE